MHFLGEISLNKRHCFQSQKSTQYFVRLDAPFFPALVCSMLQPRAFHGAQRYGDKIVIAGGTATGASSSPLDRALLYDISGKHLETSTKLPFSLSDMATVAWKDNIILMGGGGGEITIKNALNDVVLYNITNETIKILPPVRHKRAGRAAVITGNATVITGGRDEDKNVLNSIECFNIDNYEWGEFAAMNEIRE